MQILGILANVPDVESLKDCLPEIRALIREKQNALRLGLVPPEKLIVHQTISRNLNDYLAPVPAFSALEQLESAGKSLRPGQTLRLIYTLGIPGARAWDVPAAFDPRTVNIPRYQRLLSRAVDIVLEPITGIDRSWLTQTKQLILIS